jgi:hypothetical protein
MIVQSYGQYDKTINYDCKVCSALACVLNYDHKRDATICYGCNMFILITHAD